MTTEREDARRERNALIQQRARELREEQERRAQELQAQREREREQQRERDRARARRDHEESLRAAQELAEREGRNFRWDK